VTTCVSHQYSYLMLTKPNLDEIREKAQKHIVAGFAFKDLTAVAAKAAAFEKQQSRLLADHLKKSKEHKNADNINEVFARKHVDPEVAFYMSATNPYNDTLKLYNLLFFKYQSPSGKWAYTFGWTSEKWDITGEWALTALEFLHAFGYRGEALLVDVVEDSVSVKRFNFNDSEKKIELVDSQHAEGERFRDFLDKYTAPVNLLEVNDNAERSFLQTLVLGLELEKREK